MKVEEISRQSLRTRTMQGFGWSFSSAAIQFGLNFGVGIILARLLSPSDFGLLSLAMIAIGFANIVADLGVGQSLIQFKDITERHIRVGFTISFIMGNVLALILYQLAPFAATFFKNNQVEPIMQVLSLSFVFKGVNVTSTAILRRKMDFKTLLIVERSSYLLGYAALTIPLALWGFGVWSLVIGSLVQNALESFLSYRAVKHSIRPLLALKEIKNLAGFSLGMSLTQVANYFALQGDFFIVGRFLDSTALGLYARAYNLMKLPLTYFVSVFSKVLFPAISQIQDDRERVKRAYVQTISIINFFILPLSIAMVIWAPELIRVLYGEKWINSVLPLQVLSLFGAFRAQYNVVASFIRAKGFAFFLFFCQIVYASSVLLGSWVTVTTSGILGVALSVGLSILLMYLLMAMLANRITGTSVWEFVVAQSYGLAPTVPVLVAGFVSHRITHFFHLSPIITLLLGGIFTLIGFGGILIFIPSDKLGNIPGLLLDAFTRTSPTLTGRLHRIFIPWLWWVKRGVVQR